MRPPIFTRPFTPDEQPQIQAGLRSSDAFVLRRSQILLASARGERAPVIARQLGCDDQTVRKVIHAFNTSGLTVFQEGSSRPHRLRTTFSEEAAKQVPALLHRSPHDVGKASGLWTLDLVAQVSFEQGLTSTVVSDERIRRLIKRLGLNWKRAKHADHQPRPAVPGKKNARDRLIAWASQQPTWAIGFGEEVWWSRFALPAAHAAHESGPARPAGRTSLAQGRPRSQGAGLLWGALAGRHAPSPRSLPDVAALRHGTPRQC